jgi:hypothetical protein
VDGHKGGELFAVPVDQQEIGALGLAVDNHFTVLVFTVGTDKPNMVPAILKSEQACDKIPAIWTLGLNYYKIKGCEGCELDDHRLLQGNKDAMCGGPTCTFQGKEAPYHVNVLPNASITFTMLAEMLSNIDCAGMFDHEPNGPKPFLLLDGHHSQFELPFLSYIVDFNEHPWVVCIGVPYGTHIWQVADLSELNGAFKMGLTNAKNLIYAAKQNDMKKWLVSDLIPIIYQAFQTSFGMVDKALKAIIDQGCRTLNYALLEHHKVLKTKPVPLSNDSSSEVPSDHLLELATSDLMNGDAETININVSKGAAGKAIDAIVLSEVKSDGRRKACRERMEREEDVAAFGKQLTKMGRVTSGAMASQGNYCLGTDIH